ncbi:MAG: hypothetical protein LBO00_07225 [Zoogloeaceae bacterium]|nr:hypothetical protein [Zoogloeaceae bacterium]
MPSAKTVKPREFNLIGGYAIRKGFHWSIQMARLVTRLPRVMVDLSGMQCRMEIYDTRHPRKPPLTYSTQTGHIVLSGAAGTIEINIPAADTALLDPNTAGRYRLIFVDSLGREGVYVGGRIAILESDQ